MLEVTGLAVTLGGHQILKKVSFSVGRGQIVGIIGRNGSGKSTSVRAVMGLVPVDAGTIRFQGQDISSLSTRERSARGIAYVPQTGAIFPDLSVEENLRLGARLLRERSQLVPRLDTMYSHFPSLAADRKKTARFLSGGQQRMLAAAMALVRDASLLMLDEPSAGLSPVVAQELLGHLFSVIGPERSILLVEQNIELVLSHAQEICVVRDGVCEESMTPAQIRQAESVLTVI
jgi:ABC-type branched-subunit amino acid transport system ATPase component